MVKDTESLDYSGEQSSRSKKADSIFIWVVGFILVFFVVDWHFLKGEIVEYPMMPCKDGCTGWIPLNRSIYKPSVKNQTVQYWMPGISAPETLKNCSVVNRKNWKCTYEGKTGEVGFESGNYFAYDFKDSKIMDLGKDWIRTYKPVWWWHYIGPDSW